MAKCLDIWDSIKPDNIKEDYEDGACDALKDGFTDFPYSEKVYRNLMLTTQYDVWITDGNKEDKQLGYKRMVSYPYDQIVFEIGDYLTFNYGKQVNSNWLLESLDTQKKYDVNGRVLKCNNLLKWIDENGVLQSYPCVVEDKLTGGRKEQRSIVTFTGDITVEVQLNEDTEKLDKNRRFLFSNLNSTSNVQVYAYEVDLIENFGEGNIVSFHMSETQRNDAIDDITNRVADAFATSYTVEIDQDDFEQIVGYTSQLTATVKLNDEVVLQPIIWSSSDENIGTVDSLGNINLLSTGNVVFTATMENNPSVLDNVTVDVVATPSGVIDVIFDPNVTEVFQDDSQSYNVVKYLDNVAQADTFNFVASGANTDNYELVVVDDNNFIINGLGYDPVELVVTATSNVDASIGIINIMLKGIF